MLLSADRPLQRRHARRERRALCLATAGFHRRHADGPKVQSNCLSLLELRNLPAHYIRH